MIRNLKTYVTIGSNLEQGIEVVYSSNSRSVVSYELSMLMAGTDSLITVSHELIT